MSKVSTSTTGYTIVETMIFLAVSGALFLSVMLLVNGQQRRTAFATTVREFDSKLQSVINNVASGYYNNTGNTKCDVVGGVLTVTANGGTTGENGDCTFIGQYIELAPTSDKFIITSIAGARRIGIPPREAVSVEELYLLGLVEPIRQTAEDYPLTDGITASMKVINPARNIPTIAVFTSFNQYNSNGTLSSGSSKSDIWAIDIPFYVQNPSPGIEICLTDGEQFGSIILNTASTRVTMGDGSACP